MVAKKGGFAYNQEGDTGGCTERWNQCPAENEDRAGRRTLKYLVSGVGS